MKTVTPILERCIVCPKCERKTMRKSLTAKSIFGSELGREYFCDQCHLYFGIGELVNHWNYDAGDFGDTMSIDDILIDGEPFKSLKDYDESYEVVDRMFRGIPEFESDGCGNDSDLYNWARGR